MPPYAIYIAQKPVLKAFVKEVVTIGLKCSFLCGSAKSEVTQMAAKKPKKKIAKLKKPKKQIAKRKQAKKPTEPRKPVVKWLLDSDPAIRWQVMRDLAHEFAEAIAAERARVATEGWGAELLRRQNADGTWGDDEGETFRRWNSTLATMQLLWEMGLDPKSEQSRKAIGLLNANYHWPPDFGSTTFFEGEVEPCINGRVLGLGAYFGHPNQPLLERLLGEQLADGGWNCDAEVGSVRSSFHTTICVLEGLLEYEKTIGATPALTAARKRGEEFLLERHMFWSLSTGKAITLDKKTGKPAKWKEFSFPTTWHYDILRGLDYLRSTEQKPDKRVTESVELVATKQHQNGRWPRQNIHRDPINFEMEGAQGTASRWNTLRALRVMEWWAK